MTRREREDGARGYDEITNTGGVPVRTWTRGVAFEDAAQRQLMNIARLPFVHSHLAAMPDVHLGVGATIGSVIPTVGAIVPAAVGVDIGCGMVAQRTSLSAAELPDKSFFRIGETADLVGVEPHVLRYWESEFRMRPHRSASGQRMYRRDDIAHFLRIRRLLHDDGFTIAGARKILSGNTGVDARDVEQFKAVLERIDAIRERVRQARQRFSRFPNGKA